MVEIIEDVLAMEHELEGYMNENDLANMEKDYMNNDIVWGKI